MNKSEAVSYLRSQEAAENCPEGSTGEGECYRLLLQNIAKELEKVNLPNYLNFEIVVGFSFQIIIIKSDGSKFKMYGMLMDFFRGRIQDCKSNCARAVLEISEKLKLIENILS